MEIDQGQKNSDLSHYKKKKGKNGNTSISVLPEVEQNQVNKKYTAKKLNETQANAADKPTYDKNSNTSRIQLTNVNASRSATVESAHSNQNSECHIVENTVPKEKQDCNLRNCDTGDTSKKKSGLKQDKDKKHNKNKHSIATSQKTFDTRLSKENKPSEGNSKPKKLTTSSLLENPLDESDSTDKISRSKKRRYRKKRILESLCVVNADEVKRVTFPTSKGIKLKTEAVDTNRLSGNGSSCSEVEADTSNCSAKKVKADGVLVAPSPGIADSLEPFGGGDVTQDRLAEGSLVDEISDKEDNQPVVTPVHDFSSSEWSRAHVTSFDESCVPFRPSSSQAKETNNTSLSTDFDSYPPATLKSTLGDEIVSLPSRAEENFCDKVSIPNFFAHDNVEGLFRSALLNDITLSSRCSEKEVKNFFNTYGTFSERNRSQFAEVEKLLLSGNKGDDTSSELFEAKTTTAASALESTSAVVPSSTESQSDESASEGTKGQVPKTSNGVVRQVSDRSGSAENVRLRSNFVSTSSYSPSSLLGEISEISLLNTDIQKGPIYTSPNPENKVTSSANSTQFLSSTLSPPSLNNSIFLRSEKSESRLLEIVENVLLVHEKVREQLTSDKKASPPKYSQNLTCKDSCGSKEIEENSTQSGDRTRSIRSEESSVETERQSRPGSGKWVNGSTPSEEPTVGPQNTEPQTQTMHKTENSRDGVKAEREAKKAAKLARKQKPSGHLTQDGADPGPLCKAGGGAKAAGEGSAAPAVDSTPKETQKANAASSAKEMQAAIDTVDAAVVKTKAELKAERRAKQEAQRAAKQQTQPQQPKGGLQAQNKAAEARAEKPKPAKAEVAPAATPVAKLAKVDAPKLVQHKVKLFSHLYIKQEPTIPKSLVATSHLHPAIVRLGVQYASKVVVGSNARCLALLHAIKQVIEEYQTPPQKEFSRGLEGTLQPCTAFLQECRPLSVSMTNALKHLKWQMRHLPNSISDSDAKKKLQESIDTYIREQIEVAGQAICNTVLGKISSGDVILTYGCSSLLQRILIKAHKTGTKFRVVVVDGRPWREGKEMLRRLVESGLHCSYVVITAASFIMREVTKVFLGAHALLANGYVMSRAGSSQVALLAHSYNVPVLVCCETHKFSERVHTDSIVSNELGPPDELVTTCSRTKEQPLAKWRTVSHLTPLNITYDVTPPDLVTAVVTELAILPCTSVPVILRIKPTEAGC